MRARRWKDGMRNGCCSQKRNDDDDDDDGKGALFAIEIRILARLNRQAGEKWNVKNENYFASGKEKAQEEEEKFSLIIKKKTANARPFN